ncbi:GUN4 domain-containing protein [Nostoc sp.]|uniref:GUN4 domain-containing protein n=1 Tax=Nostoc sp. TaxID=1180 RepID=UPI002FF77371
MDELKSEAGIDYRPLRDLLQAKQWEKADKETKDILSKYNSQSGYMYSFKDFPCTDLKTIDKLWLDFSNKQFGFSIQQQIWEEIKQNEQNEWQATKAFVKKVGWNDNINEDPFALIYSKLMLNIQGSRGFIVGSLPALIPFQMVGYSPIGEWMDLGFIAIGRVYLPSLVERLTECS